MVRQMEAYSLQQTKPARHNPRPAGVIQPGSASDAVLSILSESPGRFFTCEQLIRATGRSHAAVSFALLYLRDQGRIEAFPDAARNPRYMRYRMALQRAVPEPPDGRAWGAIVQRAAKARSKSVWVREG